MPDLLDGDSYDGILNREVSQQERAEAVLQYGPVLTFYGNLFEGFFQISHKEYEEIPEAVFDGYRIFRTIAADMAKAKRGE